MELKGRDCTGNCIIFCFTEERSLNFLNASSVYLRYFDVLKNNRKCVKCGCAAKRGYILVSRKMHCTECLEKIDRYPKRRHSVKYAL